MTEHPQRTINIVAAALGGEGGGVFTNWVIDVAATNGWLCQTTSLAGVAQRTGATIYYIELFPETNNSVKPIMSLFPAQGDVDIVITTEIAEAGRMIQRGFVSKDRTQVITSTHRVFGITEKIDLGDGTIDAATIIDIAQKYAKSLLSYDMAAIAHEHGSVISSALFGALAGSNALPFPKQSYIQVIKQSGKSVSTNLAAFEASFQRATSRGVEHFSPPSKQDETGPEPFALPASTQSDGQLLLEQIRRLPTPAHETAYLGTRRLIEYQDIPYASQYLKRVSAIAALDEGSQDYALTENVARYLALWMSYEDIPRVAQLKIRATRDQQIRQEVHAQDEQIIHVAEFFSPQIEEVSGMMPKALGNFLMTSPMRNVLGWFMGGRKLQTHTVTIFAVLRLLASLRHIRRRSLGFYQEHKHIDAWFNAIVSQAEHNIPIAVELAKCGRMIKGYSHTRRRTIAQLATIVGTSKSYATAEQVSVLRNAALADDENAQFDKLTS